MMWEYILLIYNEDKERTERKYGIVVGKDADEALKNLGHWYGDEIVEIEYFGFGGCDAGDTVYELNDEFADNPIFRRKFKKIIPKCNTFDRKEIYE